ncbi:hypothetical protein AAIR98_001790 [Elusimicrobium simillimum]|uniref:membrane protein insertion efficiency factor YidD n=1 Tax=Elusimicrobium simillimum TaxID=3143438 RepID=UPI003C6FEA8E
MKRISLLARKAVVFFLDVFKIFVRPVMGPAACRFYPSCTQYTKQAIMKYGLFKGSFLSGKRILKCHPFHPGGYDPVP